MWKKVGGGAGAGRGELERVGRVTVNTTFFSPKHNIVGNKR